MCVKKHSRGRYALGKNYELEFIEGLADVLRENNIPFEKNAVLKGLETDFWFSTPDGGQIIAEVKAWEPTYANKKHASNLAKQYQNVTGVGQGLVVIPGLKKGSLSQGVVSEEEFIDYLNKQFQEKETATRKKVRVPKKTERMVFAVMPFSYKYEDVHYYAMAPAAEYVNAKCYRVDKQEYTGDIIEKIKNNIKNSIAVIADLSESKPNVLYEIGFAHALLPECTIHICSTPLDKLPFDVRNWNTIEYNQGQVNKLTPKLKKRLKSVLGD